MATTAATQEAADRRESEPRQASGHRSGSEHSTAAAKHDEQTAGRRAPKRRTQKDNGSVGTIRYFLTKATSNGTPELDQEMADEHQALVASLKQDRSFVTVREWRAKADIRKGETVIEKDAVVRG